MGKLYVLPDNYRTIKIKVAAGLSGTKLDVVDDFKFGETNRSNEFLGKFPLGKVPAFEEDDFNLMESNAIAYYVSNEQLRGANLRDAALVQQWVNFADNEILPSACKWVYPTLGITQFNKQETETAKEHITRCLDVLNAYLESRTYMVGERISLADIVLASNLILLYKQVLEPSFRNSFGNVNRWYLTIVNNPEFIKAAGNPVICDKAAPPDHKKFAELHGAQARDGQRRDSQNKKKQEKPKQENKPAPAPAAGGDEPAEKEADPLAAAPKGTFDFDAFKRSFSNEDTKTKAIPLLWETFDAQHYSIWRQTYKFKDELKMTFMSSNLARGMLQRIDKLRKYAFAVIYVIGENNDNQIEGLWIMRGQELCFNLSENWNVDAPSYNFTKLDPAKQADRDSVNSYLLGETFGASTFPVEDLQKAYMCFK
jgi:elongation factor 1-gamma